MMSPFLWGREQWHLDHLNEHGAFDVNSVLNSYAYYEKNCVCLTFCHCERIFRLCEKNQSIRVRRVQRVLKSVTPRNIRLTSFQKLRAIGLRENQVQDDQEFRRHFEHKGRFRFLLFRKHQILDLHDYCAIHESLFTG